MRFSEHTTRRIELCDLLIGRTLRLRAHNTLCRALWLESGGAPQSEVLDRLDQAAHLEWIAVRAERGNIYWGGRFNRCGYQAFAAASDERSA